MVMKHLFMLFLSFSIMGLGLGIGNSSRADEPEAPAAKKKAPTPDALEDYEALNLFSEVLHRLVRLGPGDSPPRIGLQ